MADSSSWAIYRRLLRAARPYWPFLILALMAMALDAACTAAFASLLEPLLDKGLLERDDEVMRTLPILVILISIGRALGGLAAQYGIEYVGRTVIRDQRQQLFEKYTRLPTAYFDREPAGTIISRLTYNVEQIADAATGAATTMLRDGLYVIGFLVVMLLQSVPLTLTVLLLGPLLAVFIAMVSRRFRRIAGHIQDRMADLTQRAGEVVEGNRELKIYGARAQESARFARVNRDYRDQHLRFIVTKTAGSALIQLIAGAALAGIIYLVTQAEFARLSPGAFTAFLTAMLAILPSLKRLTNVQAIIQRGVAAGETLFDILDAEEEPIGGGKQPAGCRGELQVDHLSLRYGDGDRVLEDVSFAAAPGTVTALVGRSGAGKTSLVHVLAGFYEPTEGRVLLDGMAVTELDRAWYRRQVAYVGQHTVLFDATVAENIAYGELADADREAIREAARRAHALDFIDQLPAGLDTRLGAGVVLSGGQRQRISIARALLKDARILILDEATSALDTESERAIQAALVEVMRERTTFVIAHRLSTIEGADQVIVLDRGKIVEMGTHARLLAADGYYAHLHRLQFSS